MEDSRIVELFLQRDESAISASEKKYGNYCHSIADRILRNHEDSADCVNQTWLRAWDSIPPHKPSLLGAFLGKITRNLALNIRQHFTAEKRGGGEYTASLEELHECVPSPESAESSYEQLQLTQLLNGFLESLTPENRRIFLLRYWYMCPLKEIAQQTVSSESAVKMRLHRMREQLKAVLEKEG